MMCVVCGTDYTNTANATSSPDIVFKKITKYKSLTAAEKQKFHNSGGGFYDWYTSDVGPGTGAILYLTNEAMFDVFAFESNQQYKQLVVLNRDDIYKQRIVEIMMKEDFIFIGPSPPTDQAVIKTLSFGNGSLTTSPVYGIVGSSPEDSSERQASMFANYIYGVNTTSFQELHTTVRKQEKKRRRRN